MKKILAVALTLALTLTAFAACAESKETLTMATNASFPPYEYVEGDQVVGIDPEIAAAVCEKMGYDLEIVDTEFDSLISGVASGKYDFVMAGMTVTEERKQMVSFSDTYATGVQVIIVKDDSPITSVDDLLADGANYTVGVQLGTTGDLYCTGDIEEAGFGSVERFNTGTDAVLSRMEDKLRRDDLAGALAESQALPSEAAAAMSGWLDSAKLRLGATDGLAALASSLPAPN